MPRRNSDSADEAHNVIKRFGEITLGKLLGLKDKGKPSSGSKLHSRRSSNPETEFVGGFRQGHNDGKAGRPHATPIPSGYSGTRPPFVMPEPFGAPPPPPGGLSAPPPSPHGKIYMPEPTHLSSGEVSRTTQIALQQYNGNAIPNLPVPPLLPPRPHSDSAIRHDSLSSTRQKPSSAANRPPRPSLGSPATPHKTSDTLGVPDSPSSGRGRSKSSPSSIAGTVNCSGTTKSGEPCKNSVKRPTALGRVDSDADKEIERYCHVHLKEVLKPTGFHSTVANEWVKYDDWLEKYLQEDTLAALRLEMNKPASASDRNGYIYTFEIRDENNPGNVHLKVGRTVNLVKRIDEWSKQCESKEQVLRGFWPGGGSADPSNLMKGRVKPGDPGKYCYRLEGLIHLELADLMQNKPYLITGFPNIDTVPDRNASPAEKRKCPDCGKTHKEIFTFERFAKGKYKGKEYEVIVKAVVEKWGKYVEKYVDGPKGS